MDISQLKYERIPNPKVTEKTWDMCTEYEYRIMLTIADLITTAALSRKESRGAHYRTDYKSYHRKRRPKRRKRFA